MTISMKLYYGRGTCSLASHIALIEGGFDFTREEVDLKTKRTEGGHDFAAINLRGYVPALDTPFGLITENPAVLMYIADRAGAIPQGEDYYRLIEWLSFIGTELHGNYHPLFAATDEDARQSARAHLDARYELTARLMGGKDWLVGNAPGIADNYLFVTTLWARHMKIDLPQAIAAFRDRNLEREAVKQAMKAERLV